MSFGVTSDGWFSIEIWTQILHSIPKSFVYAHIHFTVLEKIFVKTILKLQTISKDTKPLFLNTVVNRGIAKEKLSLDIFSC